MFLKFSSNVCRVCLEEQANIALFKNSGNDEKFKTCTRLEVSEDDGLPSSLCKKCFDNLKTAYEFYTQSIASDQHLHSFVSSINTQFAAKVVNLQQNTSVEKVPIEIPLKTDDPLPEEAANGITEIAEADDGIAKEEYNCNSSETSLIEVDEFQQIQELSEIYEEESNEFDDEAPPAEYSIDGNEKETVTDSKYSQDDSNTCVECNKSFSSRANLMRHILSHAAVKPYKCTVCDGTFTQNGSLQQHMLKHTGERPFQCDVCEKRFTRKRLLEMHQRTHTGEKPYHCTECGLSFTVKEGLRRHNLFKHASVARESHTCTICGKKLFSKYTLNIHMNLHGYDKRERLQCKLCSKTFLTKYGLRNHEQGHDDYKNYSCHICSQSFTRMASLTLHLKKHENQQKQFECEICDAIFARRSQLDVHLLSHEDNGEQNFACRICKKTFTRRLNVLKHLQGHRKPTEIFNCASCNITYNTKRNLKLHLVNFHKETVPDLNTCDICLIPFVKARDLNQHTAEVHDCMDGKCEECGEHFTSKVVYQRHCREHDVLSIV